MCRNCLSQASASAYETCLVTFDLTTNKSNKKYVLWNMGICPIASKVGHVTLATPPLGSFIVPYIVLDMAYPTKKKRRV